MADEPSQLPSQFERALIRLTAALRSHTNAVLEVKQLANEVKQSLASVVAKLDHLIANEAQEASDIREVRAILFGTAEKLAEASHGVKETRKELEETSDRIIKIDEEITGTHRLPTPDELQRAEDANRWRMLRATAKFFKDHWPHITISSGFGATLYHFFQRFFH
jgi:chromosome segregation ATPase